MSRMFQITEDDLGELEQLLPQLADAMMTVSDSRARVKLRRCKAIVSDVRWNYGPATDVERIECSDDDHRS